MCLCACSMLTKLSPVYVNKHYTRKDVGHHLCGFSRLVSVEGKFLWLNFEDILAGSLLIVQDAHGQILIAGWQSTKVNE